MFYNATVFNQDLSGWCVKDISSKPYDFDLGQGFTNLVVAYQWKVA